MTATEAATTVPWPEPPTTAEVLARVDALGPGWRERQRALDEAVEFPHQNFAEAKAVQAQLSLDHQGAELGVDELDWILDGDDLLALLGVELADDRVEGGGLAHTRRAGDQDQPVGTAGDLHQDVGEPQRGEGGDLSAADADRSLGLAEVGGQVQAKEPQAVQVERDAELVGAAVDRPLGLGEDLVEQGREGLLRERLLGSQLDEAVDPIGGGAAGEQVDIGGSTLDRLAEDGL